MEPVGASAFVEKGGWIAIDVTPAAKKWTSRTWENYGLILQMDQELGGVRDALQVASSDDVVKYRLWPRLTLVLEGKPKAAPFRVQELNPDLEAALAKGKQKHKGVLLHLLSAKSMTSRAFERDVLSDAKVQEYIGTHFGTEVRLDGDDPKNEHVLKRFALPREFLMVVVLQPRESGEIRLKVIRPFDRS